MPNAEFPVGVVRNFNLRENCVIYTIDSDLVWKIARSPKERSAFTVRALETLIEDARESGVLKIGNLKISIEGHLPREFQSEALSFLYNSERARKLNSFSDVCKDILLGSGAIVGGIIGYKYGSEYSTIAADYLNNIHYVLAPIAGATQLFGSLGGAIAGSISGWMTGGLLSYPLVTTMGSKGGIKNCEREKIANALRAGSGQTL